MIRIFLALTLCSILISCSNYKVEQPQPEQISYDVSQNITPEITYEALPNSAGSCLKGLVVSTRGDTVKFGNVVLMKHNVGITGGQTDEFGEFNICNIEPGTYDIKITGVPFHPAVVKDVEIKESTVTIINRIVIAPSVIEIDKPIIYLYPEVETEVEVKLDYAGKLTHTYPR